MARKKQKVSLSALSPIAVTLTYVIYLAIWLVIFGILCVFWSEYLPLNLKDLWGENPSLFSGIKDVWLVFVWAAAVPLLVGLLNIGVPREISPGTLFAKGIWISINAGFFEELLYRWLRFSVAMITLPFFNLITFGLLRWVYESFLIPIADWATLGQLNDILYDPKSWVIGAAIISANGAFRDAHEYQGWFGKINAWFMGMVFFYLTFRYGLLSAIGVHVLYDIVVFSMGALAMSWRKPVRYRWSDRATFRI